MKMTSSLLVALLIAMVATCAFGQARLPPPNGNGQPITLGGQPTTVDTALARALRGKPALRIVATRGQWPINSEGGGANNYTRFEAAYWLNIGAVDAYDLRLAFTGTYAVQNGETVSNLSDYTVTAGVFGLTGAANQKQFFGNGQTATLVQVGARLVLSDPSGLEGTAGQQFQVRAGATLAAGGAALQAPVGGRNKSSSNDRMFDSASTTATQVYGNSTMTTPSGGAVSTYGFAPVAILGYQASPAPALIIWGDSISWGQGDGSDGNGNGGALERGTWQAMGGGTLPLAFANLSRSGDQLVGATATQTQARRALLPYATHIVCGLGNNDIGAGRTLAQMQADATAFWRTAKRAGLYVSQVTLTPRTTSTDSWATAANQTPVKGYEAAGYTGADGPPYAGLRGAFNAWVKTQVGVVDPQLGVPLLDAVLDFDAQYRDPANPGVWLTNGTASWPTADGTHPAPALATAGGNFVRPVYAAYKAIN